MKPVAHRASVVAVGGQAPRLVPCCPDYGDTVKVSGLSLDRLLMGNSRVQHRLVAMLDTARRRREADTT